MTSQYQSVVHPDNCLILNHCLLLSTT